MLIGTEAASSLFPELRALMKNPGGDEDTRELALEVLLSAAAYFPLVDLADLLDDGSLTALKLASRAVEKAGVAAIGASTVSALLRSLAGLYPKPNSRHRDSMSRYFIKTLIRSFEVADVAIFLGDLSEDLTCACSPRHAFLCNCRTARARSSANSSTAILNSLLPA